MPGILYVVATPIGNLEDVTLRALRVLREVAIIAAEDTRRTARLLQHYSISTRTTSLHEHNERTRTPGLIARLLDGESVALVSDAGTPLISDPGRLLVAAAHENGIKVEPIPGPSAVMAALSSSGLDTDQFVFVGFPPAKAGARRRWLANLATESRTLVLYEAPHRIHRLFSELFAELGDRPILVAREATKVHEQLVVGPISRFIESSPPAVGEFTLVIGALPRRPRDVDQENTLTDAIAEFGRMTKVEGASRRTAAQRVAASFGLSTNELYRALLTRKDGADDQG